MEPTNEEKAEGGLWGWSPESRRYVLRSGSTRAKLVKRGIVKDPDLEAQWTASREAARQRQIAAAANARVLGLGLAGGVSRSATSRERFQEPAVEPSPAPAKPEPPAPGPSMRSLLSRLAIENKDALTREDMTRDEAEQLLRRALEAAAPGRLRAAPDRRKQVQPQGRWAVSDRVDRDAVARVPR